MAPVSMLLRHLGSAFMVTACAIAVSFQGACGSANSTLARAENTPPPPRSQPIGEGPRDEMPQLSMYEKQVPVLFSSYAAKHPRGGFVVGYQFAVFGDGLTLYRAHSGNWFGRLSTDQLGRIVEYVRNHCLPIEPPDALCSDGDVILLECNIKGNSRGIANNCSDSQNHRVLIDVAKQALQTIGIHVANPGTEGLAVKREPDEPSKIGGLLQQIENNFRPR